MRAPTPREASLTLEAIEHYRDHLINEGKDLDKAAELEDLAVSVEQLTIITKIARGAMVLTRRGFFRKNKARS